MSLGDLWSILIVKLPLILVALAVWWAIHEEPEDPPQPEDDGGSKVRLSCTSRPRSPRGGPRSPRRGPHGGARPSAPPRKRAPRVRPRRYGRLRP